MKIPEQSEEVICRNYLMGIYSKYWRELLAEPLVLQYLKSHSIKRKLDDLKKTIGEICKEKEIEYFNKEVIIDSVEKELSNLTQEPANKLDEIQPEIKEKFGDSFSIKIGEILIKEIILEGIEKELQGFGVKVLKVGPGEVKFIDKETKMVFQKEKM